MFTYQDFSVILFHFPQGMYTCIIYLGFRAIDNYKFYFELNARSLKIDPEKNQIILGIIDCSYCAHHI